MLLNGFDMEAERKAAVEFEGLSRSHCDSETYSVCSLQQRQDWRGIDNLGSILQALQIQSMLV